MLCIYHVADNDGKGSGAIVRTVYPGIELLGLNHDMDIPYDYIRSQDKVVVCDFALPVDFMFELMNMMKKWLMANISRLKACGVSVRQQSY